MEVVGKGVNEVDYEKWLEVGKVCKWTDNW
jgi:hypothetical protein